MSDKKDDLPSLTKLSVLVEDLVIVSASIGSGADVDKIREAARDRINKAGNLFFFERLRTLIDQRIESAEDVLDKAQP